MTSPPPSPSSRQKSLLFALYFPSFCFAVIQGMLIPVLPLFAGNFTEQYRWIGVALAAEAVGRLVADLPAGRITARIGQKTTLLLGSSLISVATGALFWAPSLLILIALRFLSGLGAGLFNIGRHAYLTEVTTLQRRGRLTAIFGGMLRAGTFVGPAFGGFLAQQAGLRTPFLAAMLVGGVGVAFTALFLRPVDGAGTAVSSATRGSFRQILRTQWQVLLVAGSGLLLAQAVRAGRRTVLPLYAADILGLDVQTIGWIESAASAVDMSFFYSAGVLMDRFGRKAAIVPSFLIQGAGMLGVALTTGPWGLLGMAVVIGFGNGLGAGTMLTLGSDLSPERGRSEFLGMWSLLGDAGFVGAPLLVGEVADGLALPTAVVAVALTGLAAGALFLFFVPETAGPRQVRAP